MQFEPKEMQCECGNTLVVDKKRAWCTKCGKPVYHNPKEQYLHKLHNYYVMIAIALVIAFVAFMFIEVIAIPLSKVTMPK
jgi:hypothetical protein